MQGSTARPSPTASSHIHSQPLAAAAAAPCPAPGKGTTSLSSHCSCTCLPPPLPLAGNPPHQLRHQARHVQPQPAAMPWAWMLQPTLSLTHCTSQPQHSPSGRDMQRPPPHLRDHLLQLPSQQHLHLLAPAASQHLSRLPSLPHRPLGRVLHPPALHQLGASPSSRSGRQLRRS